jgi:hypothetical protein
MRESLPVKAASMINSVFGSELEQLHAVQIPVLIRIFPHLAEKFSLPFTHPRDY